MRKHFCFGLWNLGKHACMILMAGGLFTLLLMQSTGMAVMLDREGYNPNDTEDIVIIKEVAYKGHTFPWGSSRRTYLFETRGVVKESYKGKITSTTPFLTKEEVTWDGSSHRLNVHTTDTNGYVGDAVYTCGNLDPLLSSETPVCKQVSFSDNWKGSLPVIWGDKRTFVQRWRDSISSGRRFALTLEALAKSMKLEVSSSKVKSPPGDVMLMVHTDPSVLPPKGWKVEFDIEGGLYTTYINDLYGNEVDNRHQATLLRGTTFYLLRNLPTGEYTFWTRMATTLTGDYISSSNTVLFKVVYGLDSPVILVPKEGAKMEKSPTAEVRVAGNPAADHAVLEVQYSKLAKQVPYKKLREIKSGKNPFFVGKAWKCSCMTGDKLGVPLEGDFRVRARMLIQGKPFGPWGAWRHFHMGKELVAIIERPFKIISPTKGETYTNKIPVKISLPRDMGKNPQLILTWTWTPPTEKGADGFEIHGFPRTLMEKTVSLSSGKMTLLIYQDTMKVEQLFTKAAKMEKDFAGGGTFSLRAELKMAGLPVKSRYTTFAAGILGTAAKKDEEKKKDLSYHMHLSPRFLAMKTNYRLGEGIAFRLGNAPKKGLQFEVQHRPDTHHPFRTLRQAPHRFSRSGNVTVLHLRPKTPGIYQIRFRASKEARWTRWQTFRVEGASSPNPVAKVVTPQNAAAVLHLTAPAITKPRANQSFMLSGKGLWVKARISHGKNLKIAYAIQRKVGSRFADIRPKVRKSVNRGSTSLNIYLAKTGTYRIRSRLTERGAPWSQWRIFKVDRINEKLIHGIKPNSHIQKQGTSGKGIHLNPSGITVK